MNQESLIISTEAASEQASEDDFMVEFKLVIGEPKTGKSYQREVKDNEAGIFLGKSMKDVIKGESIGLQGYEFEITGGSDSCGFPMRYDVKGTARRRILAVKGVGFRIKDRGIRQRKTVRGNTISENISQINLKVLKQGKQPLGEPAAEQSGEQQPEEPPKEGAKPAEENKAEEKKEEPKEKAKPEEPKKEERKEEAPVEPEKKEEPKKEEKPEEKKEEKKKEAPAEEKPKEEKQEDKKQ